MRRKKPNPPNAVETTQPPPQKQKNKMKTYTTPRQIRIEKKKEKINE